MKNALVKYLRCEERAREQRYKISSVSMICINGPHGPKNLHQQNNLFLELVQARSSLIWASQLEQGILINNPWNDEI